MITWFLKSSPNRSFLKVRDRTYPCSWIKMFLHFPSFVVKHPHAPSSLAPSLTRSQPTTTFPSAKTKRPSHSPTFLLHIDKSSHLLHFASSLFPPLPLSFSSTPHDEGWCLRYCGWRLRVGTERHVSETLNLGWRRPWAWNFQGSTVIRSLEGRFPGGMDRDLNMAAGKYERWFPSRVTAIVPLIR